MADLRPFRDALRLAVEVARDGELADPPVPAPDGIRRFLTFRRFSTASLQAIASVLDADDDFRVRVAERATEDEVGRAGHLWLHRPDGWEDDLEAAIAAGPEDPREREALLNRLRRARDGAEAAAARARAELAAIVEDRDRLAEQLHEAQAGARDDESARTELAERLDSALGERNEAVRGLKAVEAEAADLRHRLRVAREATRDAESELAELRRSGVVGLPTTPGAAGEAPDDDAGTGAAAAVREPDLSELGDALAEAAAGADVLGRFLAEAARSIAEIRRGETHDGARVPGSTPGSAARRDRASGDRRPRIRRIFPTLPFGVVEPSDRATAAFVDDPANLILVDGYNLARTIWSGCSPEEERRRVVGLLEEAATRGGAEIRVVFDGRDDSISPVASRTVRVAYSPSGVTADEVILEQVASIRPEQPIIVVSSDREIVEGSRSAGAATVDSASFARVVRG